MNFCVCKIKPFRNHPKESVDTSIPLPQIHPWNVSLMLLLAWPMARGRPSLTPGGNPAARATSQRKKGDSSAKRIITSRSAILKVITQTPLPRSSAKIVDFMFQGLQATWFEKSLNDKRGCSNEAWVSIYQACCPFKFKNHSTSAVFISFSTMSASFLHFQVYTLPLSAQTCCANRFLWMPSDIGRLGTLTSNCRGGHKLCGCSHQATDRPLRHARSVQPNTWPFRFNGLTRMIQNDPFLRRWFLSYQSHCKSFPHYLYMYSLYS